VKVRYSALLQHTVLRDYCDYVPLRREGGGSECTSTGFSKPVWRSVREQEVLKPTVLE
jgi:hypothetical protein